MADKEKGSWSKGGKYHARLGPAIVENADTSTRVGNNRRGLGRKSGTNTLGREKKFTHLRTAIEKKKFDPQGAPEERGNKKMAGKKGKIDPVKGCLLAAGPSTFLTTSRGPKGLKNAGKGGEGKKASQEKARKKGRFGGKILSCYR